MPGFVKPQLATLKLKPPASDRWIHEIKYDGYRAQIHIDRGRVMVFTRSGLDWTKKFQVIATAFAGAPIDRAIFDGEICVVKDGCTDFSALQAELKSGRLRSMVLYMFDLLFLDGFDLRRSPQIERKRILKMLYDEAGMAAPILYSEHMTKDGQAMFEAAGRLNWEGIVSKRVDAPYRSDRNESWLKIKTAQRARFPIVGFVPAVGGIAALYLGRRDGRQLICAGKVGTGFTRAVSDDLRRKLDALVTPKSHLTKPIRKKATWVEPSLIADVEYRDVTADGHLRHPSFKGLAKDR